MFDLIEKISKKPEHKRRIFAVSFSLGITLIIFAVWLSVILPTSVREEMATESSTESSAESNSSWTDNIVTPLGAFGRNTAQAFEALKGQLGSIKDSMKIYPTVYDAPASESSSDTSSGSSSNEAEAVVY